MNNQTYKHMMDRPYIKDVIIELQGMGYDEDKAKQVLTKFYRPLKRSVGFEPNARDFAKELTSIDEAVNRKHNPEDPNQIYIGDLKDRIRKNNEKSGTIRVIVEPLDRGAKNTVGLVKRHTFNDLPSKGGFSVHKRNKTGKYLSKTKDPIVLKIEKG
ncbi:hypothetical protein [Paenibacillus sp. FSL P4-0288]|uniref:hypothetical protein n=1 Tax=Paenibacillus sp. FSL P4-0288 TaxID=2921633 RepID=UPI0030FA02B6